MMKIPTELKEQLTRGNVVLFAGMGLADQAAPTPAILARALAERAGLRDAVGLSFPEVAQRYELQMGRNSLIEFLMRRLEGNRGRSPGDVHRLVASLPWHAVITTAWHSYLEDAFSGHAIASVIDDSDVPYVSKQRLPVIKLWGDLSRKDSLVLTEADHYSLFASRPETLNLVRSYLSTGTFLFLGFDMEGVAFRGLYHDVVRNLGSHKRRAYAVQPAPPAHTIEYWRKQNVQIIAEKTQTFVKAMADQQAVTDVPPPQAVDTPRDTEAEHGLPPDLYLRLRRVLLNCGPIDSDETLRAAFVDERIRTWRNALPQTNSRQKRVTAVIDFLYHRSSKAGENGLALLLQALRDQTDPEDACRKEIAELASLIATTADS